MKRVLYVFNGPKRMSASAIYRGTMPATMINRNQQVYQVEWLWMDDLAHMQNNMLMMCQYDILVFPRLYLHSEASRLETAKLFHGLRRCDVRILYEIDDDYSNEFRRTVPGDFVEVASWADGAIVTTPLLAERVEVLTGTPAYVCPNSIIPQQFDPKHTGVKKATDKLVILLSGSPTHYEDWYVLVDVLPEFMETYKDRVELRIGAFHPDYLVNLPSTRYLPNLPYVYPGVVREMGNLDYAGLVQAADCVLCPVDPDDDFNLGKSEIKAVEGMGGGAFVIATDNPVYRLAIRHQKTGYLVEHTARAWWDALEFFVQEREQADAIAKRGYRHVWKKYNAEKNWQKWVQVFNKSIRRAPNSVILPVETSPPDPLSASREGEVPEREGSGKQKK